MLESDREVKPGPQYVPGSPVVVRIRHRANRYDIDDRGEAVRLAGRPPGWLAAAGAAVGAPALNQQQLTKVVTDNKTQLQRCYETALRAAGGKQDGSIKIVSPESAATSKDVLFVKPGWSGS